jgi:UDP-glucose 4-epimerase
VKVLITGAAGFLGSHLVDRLVGDGGYQITGLDNLQRGTLDHVRAHVEGGLLDLHVGDIRDYAAVANAMQGAEIVFHLAAQSNVMGALSDPDHCITTNVTGTQNVLKAAEAAHVRRVVFSSSREVYGEPVFLPVAENAPLLAKNTYGASKIAGEDYCRFWQARGALDCLILRFANLYGPRDRGRVIPLWLDRARNGEDLILYGGKQVLDFVWVGLAVDALIAAMNCQNDGPINVGSGTGTSLEALADRILALTGHRSAKTYLEARDVEVSRFVADVGRMRSRLGITPPEELQHLQELCQVGLGGDASLVVR